MSDLERALAKFPPSVTSRCYSKLSRTDHACQKYFSVVTSRPYGSAVRFQLTYNCGRISYSPCYFPATPHCHSPDKSLKKLACCYLK
ncbi:hypothetical protein PUN28_017131 [Cardiocondyla obscurior]|uniref:Uncharacterized protein n=1 Tax=Cardiocondyla obscurior TaxID=286306 RepID=A0AAW2EQV5_9HYME